MTQAVQEGIEALVGIELRVRDQAAGIIQRGLQEHLHPAAAGTLHPGAEKHVGLPDLVGELGFVLLVCGGFIEQQLALGESAGAQESIQRGWRDLRLITGQGQVIQQCRSGAMGAFALEPIDERGGGVGDGAHLAAILPRLGHERGEAVAAIAQRPLKQCIHRNLAARGMRNIVEARGDLLGAAGQFAARQGFQHQRGNQSIAE